MSDQVKCFALIPVKLTGINPYLKEVLQTNCSDKMTRPLMLSTIVFLMKVGGSHWHFGAVDLQKVSGCQRIVACSGCMKRAGAFLTFQSPNLRVPPVPFQN